MLRVEWLLDGQRRTWIVHGLILAGVLGVAALAGRWWGLAVAWSAAIGVLAWERAQLRWHIREGHDPEVWRDDAVGDSSAAVWLAVGYTLGALA